MQAVVIRRGLRVNVIVADAENDLAPPGSTLVHLPDDCEPDLGLPYDPEVGFRKKQISVPAAQGQTTQQVETE